MSDTMLFGVLRMSYELAMSNDLSRIQFYERVQQAADELQAYKDAAQTTPATAPSAEPVLWQRSYIGSNQWFEIFPEFAGLMQEKYEYRCLYAHPHTGLRDELREANNTIQYLRVNVIKAENDKQTLRDRNVELKIQQGKAQSDVHHVKNDLTEMTAKRDKLRGDVIAMVDAYDDTLAELRKVSEELGAPKGEPFGLIARDAARYRWLRNPNSKVALVLDKAVRATPSIDGLSPTYDYEYRAGNELDTSIDAAITAQGEKP